MQAGITKPIGVSSADSAKGASKTSLSARETAVGYRLERVSGFDISILATEGSEKVKVQPNSAVTLRPYK